MSDPQPRKTYFCHVCKQSWINHTNFVRHQRIHQTDRFICDVPGCNRVCRMASSILAHMKAEHDRDHNYADLHLFGDSLENFKMMKEKQSESNGTKEPEHARFDANKTRKPNTNMRAGNMSEPEKAEESVRGRKPETSKEPERLEEFEQSKKPEMAENLEMTEAEDQVAKDGAKNTETIDASLNGLEKDVPKQPEDSRVDHDSTKDIQPTTLNSGPTLTKKIVPNLARPRNQWVRDGYSVPQNRNSYGRYYGHRSEQFRDPAPHNRSPYGRRFRHRNEQGRELEHHSQSSYDQRVRHRSEQYKDPTPHNRPSYDRRFGHRNEQDRESEHRKKPSYSQRVSYRSEKSRSPYSRRDENQNQREKEYYQHGNLHYESRSNFHRPVRYERHESDNKEGHENYKSRGSRSYESRGGGSYRGGYQSPRNYSYRDSDSHRRECFEYQEHYHGRH